MMENICGKENPFQKSTEAARTRQDVEFQSLSCGQSATFRTQGAAKKMKQEWYGYIGRYK